MKKNITPFFLASPLFFSFLLPSARAQNTAPFWSLAGNNNAVPNSKLGTTNFIPVNLTTNNLTRIKIFEDGRVGVGGQVTNANSNRVLNLVDASAVMRILRVHNSFAPAIELLSRTTPDGANVAYWDMYAEPSDASFRIRDRQTGSNLDRLTINHANGYVGIGTTAPSFPLDVRTPFSSFGQFKATSGFAGVILDKSAANQNEYVIHRTAGADRWTEGMMNNDNFSIHNWNGTGLDALTILHSNNFVGIGVTDPAFRLEVGGRMRLRTGNGSAGLWLNNAANTGAVGFIGVLNDNHIGLWGNTGAGWSVLMNTDNGYLGVKNADPLTELHVMHGTGTGADFGVRLENTGSNHHHWTLYATNNSGNFELYRDGLIIGSFDGASGNYSPLSDARFKKNIEKSEDVLDKIMQLGVKRYQFNRNQTSSRRYYGMIAQEVEKVFPDAVYHNNSDDGKEYYTMDYSAVGVIAIKGIQELKPAFDKQQEQITHLQQQNEMLKQELAELKQMVARLGGDKMPSSAGMGVLGIATPNPVRGAARIQYEVPDGAGNARLLISDALGRTVRTVQLSKSGTVNVDVSALSSGVYNYSLVADGKTLQTKKMTIER